MHVMHLFAIVVKLARHCPNSAAVNQFFSMNRDTDINITPQDYVCTSCYNHHITISQHAAHTSTDEEVNKLLTSHFELPPWAKSYIGNALRGVICEVGNVLLKRLAVLFPKVYTCFIQLVLEEANAAGITLSLRHRLLIWFQKSFFWLHNKLFWKAHGMSVLPEEVRDQILEH